MDQHLCRCRSDLPALHSQREMDLPVAQLPARHPPLLPRQPLSGRGALHPARRSDRPGRIPVLRLPRRWRRRVAARSGLLGWMGQGPPQNRRLSSRERADVAGRRSGGGAISKDLCEVIVTSGNLNLEPSSPAPKFWFPSF